MEEEEEEELGPDAAAAEPLAAPCALRGGGGGAGPSARAPSREPQASRLSREVGKEGGTQGRAARARGPANAGFGPRRRPPPPPDGELEPPAPALIRALGNPLARLPWCPPRAQLDSAELAPLARAPGARAARQCQSMCERRELRSLESRAPESRCGGGGFVR